MVFLELCTGVPGIYSTPGHYKQQGGARDLFYPTAPQTTRGCWGPILPWVLTNSKGVLGTYATLGPHKQQGGAGIYATLSPHKQQGGAGDLFPPMVTTWQAGNLTGHLQQATSKFVP